MDRPRSRRSDLRIHGWDANAYARGPVVVRGSDIYGSDAHHNGIRCEGAQAVHPPGHAAEAHTSPYAQAGTHIGP